MISQKEIREMALADMLVHLKAARVSAVLGGFTGYEVDDAIAELINIAEFQYDSERDA
jgi:hypothetical protein